MSIFVGNLPFRAEQEDIIELFASFGEVTNCSLPLERDTGRKRGFAFVEMADEATEERAIEGLQGGWGSFKSKASDFIHDFYSLQVFSARENPGYRRMNKLFDNARNTASRIRQTANELTARYFGMSGEVELELNKMLYIADALRTSQLQDVKIVVDKNGKRKKR